MKIEATTADDLRPGDIILWHSGSLLSRIIQFFDKTRFNHASLYAGTVDVSGAKIPLHIESAEHGVWTDVLRESTFTETGRAEFWRVVLDDRPAIGALAVAEALDYMGRPYAAHTLALLAGVLTTRKWTRWLAKPFEWMASWGGKHSLICSELVHRAYRDAGVQLVDEDADLVTPGGLFRSLTDARRES